MLVFFALFGVFITQYVPIWMTQNESQFTNQAQASMETLKQYVDDQVLLGAPQTYAVPFTMNSQGIPLFAQPTQGTLSFQSAGCTGGFGGGEPFVGPTGSTVGACAFQHVGFWTKNNTTTSAFPYKVRQSLSVTTASSSLTMQLPNRYFPGEKTTFEDNAVLARQAGSSSTLLVAPPLNITHLGSNWSVTLSLLTLTGTSSSFSSPGTKAVYTTLVSNTTYVSSGRFFNQNNTTLLRQPLTRFNLTYSVGTSSPCAWYNFFNNTTSASRLPMLALNATAPSNGSAFASLTVFNVAGGKVSAPTGHLGASSCANSVGTTYFVQLVLYRVSYARVYSGVEAVSFSVGGL